MGRLRLFKTYLRIPFLVLACLEFMTCVLAVYVAAFVRLNPATIADLESIHSPIGTAILFGLVIPASTIGTGVYQGRYRGGVLGIFLRTVIGFVLGGIVLAIIYYAVPSLYLGRGVFGIAMIIAFFMIGTIRPIFFYYVDNERLQRRVLVLGTGHRAASISRRLRRHTDRRGFTLCGYLQLNRDYTVVVPESAHIDLADRSLADYCHENDVHQIVVAIDSPPDALPTDELLQARLHGVEVIDLLTFFEREQGKLPLDILRSDWLVFADGFERGALRDLLKRGLDLSVGTIMLLLAAPFMLATAIAIKLEDGWGAPVFYRQVRVGYRERAFDVIKFRSMRVDAEASGTPEWARRDDDRITRVGRFIRRTRLDELPQIFNVLRGDMSLVGPRPERPYFVEELQKRIDYYHERHAVKPGITGWAQVRYPYGASYDDSVQKQEFDLYYVKNHSLFLDTLILCQTAEVVLFGNGAR